MRSYALGAQTAVAVIAALAVHQLGARGPSFGGLGLSP
jgi:hypothetical protein